MKSSSFTKKNHSYVKMRRNFKAVSTGLNCKRFTWFSFPWLLHDLGSERYIYWAIKKYLISLNIIFQKIWFHRWLNLPGRVLPFQSHQKRNNRTICDICSKLIIKTREWHQWRLLVSFLITLNIFDTLFWSYHCWLWTSKYWLGCRSLLVWGANLNIDRTVSE